MPLISDRISTFTPPGSQTPAPTPASNPSAPPPATATTQPAIVSPLRGTFPPDELSDVVSDNLFALGRGGIPQQRFARIQALEERFQLRRLQSNPAQVAAAPTAAASGTPLQLETPIATESPFRTASGEMKSLVSVSFTVNPSDTAFDNAEIWFTGYNASSTAQLMASGRTSPVSFLCDTTGETVTVTVVAVGSTGISADPSFAPTTTVVLDGVISAPPSPTIAQTLIQTPVGYQFSFNQLAGLSADQISGYRIWKNTTNNTATATQLTFIAHNPKNSTPVVVQDTAANGVTNFYWVSAVNTTGLESGLVAAQTGAIVSGQTIVSDNLVKNGDFDQGNFNWTIFTGPTAGASFLTAQTGLPRGATCLQLTSQSGANMQVNSLELIPIDPTKTYLFECWANIPVPLTASCTLRPLLVEYDSNKNIITPHVPPSGSSYFYQTIITSTTGNTWQYLTFEATGSAATPAAGQFNSNAKYVVAGVMLVASATTGQVAKITGMRFSEVAAGNKRALTTIDSGGIIIPTGIDFIRGYTNKNQDNVPDGATFGSLPLANIAGTGAAKRALIDFTQGHANKIIDNLGDGTYARTLATRVNVGRPLIDFSETFHLNKNVSNLAGTLSDNLAKNGDFDQVLTGWTLLQGSGTVVSATDYPRGSHSFISNAVQTDLRGDFIPVDINKTYFIEAYLKIPAAGAVCYLGFSEADGNQTQLTRAGAFAYALAAGITSTTGNTWQYFAATVSGNSASPTAKQFLNTAKFIRPMLLANWTGTTAAQQVQLLGFRISEVAAGSVRALGFDIDGNPLLHSTARNLVFNSNFLTYTQPNGLQATYASAVRVNDNGNQGPNGWTRNFEASATAGGEGYAYRSMQTTFTPATSSGYVMVMQDGLVVGSAFSSVCDAFPVVPGKQYRVSASVNVGFGAAMPASGRWYFRILFYKPGTTDFSRLSTSLSANTVVGTSAGAGFNSTGATGSFDIASGSTLTGALTPASTVTAPADAAYARIAFYKWYDGVTVPAVNWNLAFGDVSCVPLTVDGEATFNSSTVLNGQGGMVPNQSYQISWSASATTISLSWTAASLLRGDGSTLSVAGGSQSYTVSASTTYYIYPYISVSGTVGFANANPPGTAASATTAAQAGFDGRIPLNPITITTPASGTTTGTGGDTACPEEDELVEELHRGQIRAGDVRAGDYIKGYSFATQTDVYRRVLATQTRNSGSWRMVNGYCVSPSESVYVNNQWTPAFRAPGAVMETGLGVRVDICVEADAYQEHNFYLVSATGAAPLLIHNAILPRS